VPSLISEVVSRGAIPSAEAVKLAATLNVPVYIRFHEEMVGLKEPDLRRDAITGATSVEIGSRLRELRLFAESIRRRGAKKPVHHAFPRCVDSAGGQGVAFSLNRDDINDVITA
jgi:hypothetical protein